MCYLKKEMLTDCSTSEIFCFSLRCVECGEIWKSTPIHFSKAGVIPKTKGKEVVFDTLYRREKEAALTLALREAEKYFSSCPICHRLVCDHCFMVCEDLDMCVSCAAKLQEQGETVATDENRK